MSREEASRLTADISRAIKSSDLLALLHPSSQSRPNRKRTLSEIPKSILDAKVAPVRNVLEKIDACRLLDLDIIPQRNGRPPRGSRVRDGVYCRSISDQIQPPLHIDDDTMSDENDKSSVVRYLHIAEVPDEYTIGIFVFGPHERIPLHDHPEMCVLSRILYGELHRHSLDLDRQERSPNEILSQQRNSAMTIEDDHKTYDLAEYEEDLNDMSNNSMDDDALEKYHNSQKFEKDNNSSNSSFLSALSRSATWLHNSFYNNNSNSDSVSMGDFSSGDYKHVKHLRQHQQQHQHQPYHQDFPEGTKVAYQNAMDVLEAPNVASLYPYEGNLHEFVAGPHGAAVLDVLLPPYDDGRKRDCTFYHIRELTTGSSNHRSAVAIENEAMATVTGEQRPCIIVPTGQPENFHCISGQYKDLGENDDFSDYDSDE